MRDKFYAIKTPGTNRWQVMERIDGLNNRLVQPDLSKAAAINMAGSYNG